MSLKLVDCFSPTSLSHLLLMMIMIGNIHPNPGPVFPCSVSAGNVTWRGRSVQCCTCSKWVHLTCSLLSVQIEGSEQLLLLELSSLLRPCLWRSHIYQHYFFLCGVLHFKYLHWSIRPLCQCSVPAPISLQTSFRLLCISSRCTLFTSSCFLLFSYISCFLP